MIKEFKEFALRGNVLDMAVGIIIGASFGSVVSSLVEDVIMPPIGFLLGKVDFSNLFILLRQGEVAGPYLTIAEAQLAGAVTLNYGLFINTIITFLIVAFAVFLLIRSVNKLQRFEETATAELTSKKCPFCFMDIPIKAIRCPQCTSDLERDSG
ncbi:MAG: large-conductance mechanosensitive channel protein MscL [Anaerolineales bacterium]|nr:large-conductance mechanosensitive channel protein MscL [Anaerolineales bacterium]MCK5633603.1 large-conductance mechanosensitive channel protein MscL [Anaerolineales bacterium]